MRIARMKQDGSVTPFVFLLTAAALILSGLARQAIADPHAGMAYIPGGTFWMGSDDGRFPDAVPVHRVKVDAFWMDRTDVTNAQFVQFVKATGYVTLAERALDPAKYPNVSPDLLKPGSLIFTPPSAAVPLDDPSRWWQFVAGADWRHPLGPANDLHGKENHPVVNVAWADAAAYAKWAGKRL